MNQQQRRNSAAKESDNDTELDMVQEEQQSRKASEEDLDKDDDILSNKQSVLDKTDPDKSPFDVEKSSRPSDVVSAIETSMQYERSDVKLHTITANTKKESQRYRNNDEHSLIQKTEAELEQSERVSTVMSESDLDFDIDFARIKVIDPQQNTQGKTEYKIEGYDKMGFFSNISRRYKDFFSLHDLLAERFKGLYVPQIPPKKALGNKDDKFIEERRALLQDFLVNIHRFQYLWQSEEFSAFIRSPTESKFSDNSEQNRVERYQQILRKINRDRSLNINKLINCQHSIKQIEAFAQKNIPWLKNLSVLFKQLMEKYEKQFESQNALRGEILDYQTNVCQGGQNNFFRATQTGKNQEKNYQGVFVLKSVILNQDDSFENKNSHDSLVLDSNPDFKPSSEFSKKEDLRKRKPPKNTLKDVYLWSKSELNELISLQEAVKFYSKFEQKIEQFASKHKINQKDMKLIDHVEEDDVSDNSQIQQTMLKNDIGMKPEEIDKFNDNISQIQPQVQLKNLVMEILGFYIIPQYKKQRAAGYRNMLKDFVQAEKKNSQLSQEEWVKVYQQMSQ